MSKNIIVILLLSIGARSYSQQDESIISLDYALAPSGDDQLDYNKKQIKLTYPLKLGDFSLKNSFYAAAHQYSSNDLSLGMEYDTDTYYKIAYQPEINYQWTNNFSVFGFADMGISSTLEEKLVSDDYILNYGAGFSLSLKKTILNNIEFGLAYNTTFGKQQFTPLVKADFQLSEAFNLQAGFPLSKLAYKINDRQSLSLQHLYSGNLFNDYPSGETVEMQQVSTSLDYNLMLDTHWGIHFSAGYFHKNDIQLHSEKTTVQSYSNPGMTFSTGFQFKL
ncbi:DUF6268 family outer membrane beta-barrel protein [Zunongwangia pacifica]|uniref:DUF6268 family outer membrane beta-barrel protein n=1 Tax=Zunongwangia pacifica TaxID=2911062 RepID=A0A9X2CMW6_9FLAO|nr:DUF6268 family outer membrane beta-barrel protein [Zunongwangia pacifica]MCL6219930.1 DUF6268 family outer membrane beta-barrel protein [Zunongwangia pacifica]